jgi:hypothetical protein
MLADHYIYKLPTQYTTTRKCIPISLYYAYRKIFRFLKHHIHGVYKIMEMGIRMIYIHANNHIDFVQVVCNIYNARCYST